VEIRHDFCKRKLFSREMKSLYVQERQEHQTISQIATVDIQQYIIALHRMYKVTVFIFSSYKLDKNSAQNIHFVQNNRTVSRDSLKIRSDQKPEIQQSSCDFDEDDKKIVFFFFFIYISRVSSIALSDFLLGHLRYIQSISESRKSVKLNRSEYHLGWTHAEYRVYHGPLCSCKNRCSAFGSLLPVHLAGRDIECSVFKYKISDFCSRSLSFSSHRFLCLDHGTWSDLCYSRFTDLR